MYFCFLVAEFVGRQNPVASDSVFLISKFLEGIISEWYKAQNSSEPGKLYKLLMNSEPQTSSFKPTGSIWASESHPIAAWTARSVVLRQRSHGWNRSQSAGRGLQVKGTTAVGHLTLRKNNAEIPTKYLVINFDGSTLSEYINAGLIVRCSVWAHILNSCRCFKRQRFRHSRSPCHGWLTFWRLSPWKNSLHTTT